MRYRIRVGASDRYRVSTDPRDVDLEVIAHRWLREWRPFPGVIFWRQERRQQKSTLGEVVKAIEALAEREDPFAYPIVYLRPQK